MTAGPGARGMNGADVTTTNNEKAEKATWSSAAVRTFAIEMILRTGGSQYAEIVKAVCTACPAFVGADGAVSGTVRGAVWDLHKRFPDKVRKSDSDRGKFLPVLPGDATAVPVPTMDGTAGRKARTRRKAPVEAAAVVPAADGEDPEAPDTRDVEGPPVPDALDNHLAAAGPDDAVVDPAMEIIPDHELAEFIPDPNTRLREELAEGQAVIDAEPASITTVRVYEPSDGAVTHAEAVAPPRIMVLRDAIAGLLADNDGPVPWADANGPTESFAAAVAIRVGYVTRTPHKDYPTHLRAAVRSLLATGGAREERNGGGQDAGASLHAGAEA